MHFEHREDVACSKIVVPDWSSLVYNQVMIEDEELVAMIILTGS